MNNLSREVPIDPAHAALLIIDVQNYCVSSKSEKTEYFRQKPSRQRAAEHPAAAVCLPPCRH
jgi:isochorismate hydrolase